MTLTMKGEHPTSRRLGKVLVVALMVATTSLVVGAWFGWITGEGPVWSRVRLPSEVLSPRPVLSFPTVQFDVLWLVLTALGVLVAVVVAVERRSERLIEPLALVGGLVVLAG